MIRPIIGKAPRVEGSEKLFVPPSRGKKKRQKETGNGSSDKSHE